MSFIALLCFMSIFIGFARKRAAYGLVVLLCGIYFRTTSEVASDLWWSSCLFCLIGAGMLFLLPVKAEKKEEA